MELFENLNVEFKSVYTNDIKKTVVAFANTDGGKIYIGILDDGTVVGVENIDDVLKRLASCIRESIKPDITMFVDYEVKNMANKKVIVVSVQIGTGKPYYIASKGIRPEGVFVRQGATTAPATETNILKMIKETDGDSFESARSTVQELEFEILKKEFAAKRIELGDSQMRTLNLVNEQGLYTNLALLLSDECPHTIKVAVFEGVEKNIFTDRYEFKGSLLKQLKDSYAFIDRYNRTSAIVNGLERIDSREYPEEAIRETLLNAIVHRDYSYLGSTLISIFDDRIEVVSFGGLARGIEYDDMMLGVSFLRNRELANVFYRLKLIEAYGIGIPKIFRSYLKSKTKPKIEVSSNAVKVILPNQQIAKKQDASLNDMELLVIETIKKKREIKRKEIEKASGLSQTSVIRVLSSLKEKELVVVVGAGKNTKYKLK